MGSSLEGVLAYGYDLGGTEKWHMKGVQEYEPWRPSWATAEELEAIDVTDDFDYDMAISAHLAAAGLDLQVVQYGVITSESSGIMLVAYAATSMGGRTLSVELPDMLARRDIERWDEALLKALEVLDIRPWQPNPTFLLTQSCW